MNALLVSRLLDDRDLNGYCESCGYHRTQKHIHAVGHSDKCLYYRAAMEIIKLAARIDDLEQTLEVINASDA